MDAEGFYTWGEPVSQDGLKDIREKALVKAIDRYPFTTLLETRRKGDDDAVIVEYQVERPQNPPVPILNRERIAIAFNADEDVGPRAYALRRDFPETIHQNMSPPGQPKDLCLFEDDYLEIRDQLTPVRLLERIADWLARAAVEELHLSEQPLEPYLLSLGRIIFESDVLDSKPSKRPIIVVRLLSDDPILLRAFRLPDGFDYGELADNFRYLMLPVDTPPAPMRSLSHLPLNLQQLSGVVTELGMDFEDEIRRFIKDLRKSGAFNQLQAFRLIILLRLPKTRAEGGSVEETEWCAFLVQASLADLAVKLGTMAEHEGNLGVLLGQPESDSLDKFAVIALRPTFAFSQLFAQKLSGLSNHNLAVVAVGVGALGSQATINLVRQGVGAWTIIDHDNLLPHNLARHALGTQHVGQNKAEALANEIRLMMGDNRMARAFPVNFLMPQDARAELEEALHACDLLVDFSTSRAVARALARTEYPVGRISAFLSSNGQHLILLFEGQERLVRLDDLEMQLAAAIAENQEFHGIYTDTAESISYASSCRDVSAQLPQDSVAIHAGVVSQFIKANATSVEPSINIWKWSESALSLTRHRVQVYNVGVAKIGDWSIRASSHVSHLLRFYRRRRLPSETGGVLLGRMDYEHHIIYIATALPSPPDSVEWPGAYIRGAKGLRKKVQTFNRVTGGDLSYVGEWHSHPVGSSSKPSEDDIKAHRWLVAEMGKEGLPGLVAIQGDNAEPEFLVASEV